MWLRGEHDASTVDELWEIMIRAIEIDSSDIVIDLNGVTFIGSATIRVIERTCVMLQRRSRSLIVRSPSRRARRALDLYDVADTSLGRVVRPCATPLFMKAWGSAA